mgnify:FL=1
MALLTDENQQKVVDLLIGENTLTADQVEGYRINAKSKGTPLLTELIQSGAVTEEDITRGLASVSNIPYVNLNNVTITQDVLALLPKDVAEWYMAVPIGMLKEGNGKSRLAVAMLDANNVQAVDFLANKIQQPLKVYMASEKGVQHVLDQYHADLAQGVSAAITSAQQEEQALSLIHI